MVQAISSLAEAAYDTVEIPEDAVDDQPETYCLSPLYNPLMAKVLEVTQRSVCLSVRVSVWGVKVLYCRHWLCSQVNPWYQDSIFQQETLKIAYP